MVIKNNQVKSAVKSNQPTLNCYVIDLKTFEDFIQVAHLLKTKQGNSNLYQYQGHYYLELTFNDRLTKFEQDKVKDQLSLAYEYGHKSSIQPSTLKNHGKLIMKNNALAQGRYYFH
ncbi:hypothetical protein HGK75_01715 [uncultured bacterium]|uniref:Uncharacterized protein n=1 Tax=Acetilactobacillus jinshanensis TaxID=1720083 RepID=A0A4P6ZMG0_9LACO|nr:hypothetical protein ELX58_01685 [Acetilactobacillus jinshanensis]URL61890.1 hypothetical protein HGK75_01715 [uncultured bacterium]